jgi:hypothetical protein
MKRAPNRSKRHWYWVLAVVAAAAVGFVIWLRWPENLGAIAEKSIDAVEKGDAGFLLRYAFEDEVEAARWTREDINNFWQISVLPRISKYHETGKRQVVVNANRSQGLAWVNLVDDKGHKMEIMTSADITDEGAGFSPMNYVTLAWEQEYVVERGRKLSTITALEARIEGLAHDRAKLEAAGLKGMPLRDGSGRFFSWDQALRSWQDTLNMLKDHEKRNAE